jgi:predicted GIY-YIG superfamily endonuclease
MVYVYVLKSLVDGARYTGMATDVAKRLVEHNSGKNRYTKGHMPWAIIYTEEQADWKAARIREVYLKSAAGRRWLDKELKRGSLPA